MQTGMFHVKGMQGNDDVDKVLKALHHVWGVRRAEINDVTGNARFSFDENAASLHDFQQAIIEAGFDVEQEGQSDSAQSNERGSDHAHEGM